jgi:succinyl-diaminopimelate desuccinylase
MSGVLALASKLMTRVSLTPDDAGCQQLISERLAACGFGVEWFCFGEVTNVLLTRGSGSPSLWFLGHTDVVPPGPDEDWSSPPFEPEVRDGVLYGRGAADMKGAVAAMVVALESFAQSRPDHGGQAGLLLTSDEEGVAVDGIGRVAERLSERGMAPDYCLVGEPSSQEVFGDTVRIGRRGSVCARLLLDGVQGHTAFIGGIDNPVHRLAPFLAELVSTDWDRGDENFPPTHCQVSNFAAGTGAENVTPGHADLMFNFRNMPASSSEALRHRVEDMLARHGIEKYELQWRISGEPFRSQAGALRAAITEVLGEQLDTATEMNTGGGTSDGRFMAPLGTEVLEFGLLNRSIHKVDENTAVEDLDRLAGIYTSLLEKLLPN